MDGQKYGNPGLQSLLERTLPLLGRFFFGAGLDRSRVQGWKFKFFQNNQSFQYWANGELVKAYFDMFNYECNGEFTCSTGCLRTNYI